MLKQIVTWPWILDAQVLVVTTRLSHGLQRWIGWTCFRQAALLLTLILIGNGIDIADYWFVTLKPAITSDVATVVVGSLSTLSFWFTRAMCVHADAAWAESADALPRSAMILQEYSFACRLFALAFSPIGLAAVTYRTLIGEWLTAFSSLGVLLFALVLYLFAVTPLRPGTTRVQELVADIRAGLQSLRPIAVGGSGQ
jgi:hypothetical protein